MKECDFFVNYRKAAVVPQEVLSPGTITQCFQRVLGNGHSIFEIDVDRHRMYLSAFLARGPRPWDTDSVRVPRSCARPHVLVGEKMRSHLPDVQRYADREDCIGKAQKNSITVALPLSEASSGLLV